MSDLAEFLLARIAEDEAVAREVIADLVATPESYGDRAASPLMAASVGLTPRPFVQADPARVLAECEAKRRIVDLHGDDHECSTYDHNGERDNCTWVIGDDCSTMRLLALPYADHTDYRQEWRP